MANGSISVAGATAIGVGGMMGAGLYTLLGLASTAAGVWLPVAFLIGGVVSVFSVYSYAKLGAVYPSRGGAAQYLIRCFGDGIVAGGLNIFQFLGWIIAMALYASGFAGYLLALLPWQTPGWAGKAVGIGLIVVVVAVNLVGNKLVARSEVIVVSVELVILVVFAAIAGVKADPARFTHNADHSFMGVLFAAGLLYVTYEGFGVVTNSAGDMRDPARELPRAMFTALGIVVAVYVVHGGTAGLFTAAGLTAAFVLFFPLAAVGQMASLAFLLVYGTVSLGHLRVWRKTGAKPALLVTAVLLNLALFVLLLGYTVRTGPASTWITLLGVLVVSFGVEYVYRRRTGRRLRVESSAG